MRRGAKRPNILLITADDMNYNSVGIYGCGIPLITPNIDRLASQGMRFTHSHVTIAVCQPCRSALMTGRYPHRNGAEGFEPIDMEVPTLQEQLHSAGYINGIMGKNSHLAPREKFCWDYYIAGSELGRGRDPALYYQHARQFFEDAKSEGKLFYLMANAQDPHRPFAGSQQEFNKWNEHMPYDRQISLDEAEVPGFLPELPDVRQEISEYFTSVHRCDEVAGAVLRALKDTGFEDNTLVMFLSDHGMPLPFAKTNCYLNSTKTPWIVRWPGMVRPDAVDSGHFISGIDYMPTML
ncbi:MAG: sulfatase-like hydrolase/transferase, partial [Gammaproteobacteria bacterium]